MADTILSILVDLTGQDAPFPSDLEGGVRKALDESGLGYSQFNELLLLLGYDRVTPAFFQFLVDDNIDASNHGTIKSLEQLRAGVDRFRILAIRSFGNVKFGFKYLSAPTTDLREELASLGPVDEATFTQRHVPLLPIDPIPGEKTYYLGYIIERQLKSRLERNPDDAEAKRQLEERMSIVAQGRRNHEAYLASDHMDVYVATSMRERHEYQIVNQVIKEVSGDPALQKLKVRWFDPTQAYCMERIDKGLAEALMLKRAACTLYLAQESDTLGKDSELASTLAQGKPVVAYIPRVTEQNQDAYVDNLLQMIATGSPGSAECHLILGQLQAFAPKTAWGEDPKNADILNWIAKPASMDIIAAKRKLGEAIRAHYDKRAAILKEDHPLGIQVHLQTGVANGVLVARTTGECAQLIHRILTSTLEFLIVEHMADSNRCNRYLLLKEKMTGSVFRVATGDRFLTNAFWNFYLAK